MTLIWLINILPREQVFCENINAYNALTGFIVEHTLQLCNLTLKDTGSQRHRSSWLCCFICTWSDFFFKIISPLIMFKEPRSMANHKASDIKNEYFSTVYSIRLLHPSNLSLTYTHIHTSRSNFTKAIQAISMFILWVWIYMTFLISACLTKSDLWLQGPQLSYS